MAVDSLKFPVLIKPYRFSFPFSSRSITQALQCTFNPGTPKIRFIVDSEDSQWFNNAVEKIDFVLELLPYHLDPEKLPNDVSEVIYQFDSDAARWRLNTAFVKDKKYVFSKEGWKIIT